ncbi:MAG: formylglycine-generating enzyme family protein, partial [Kordiimonas sp.]
TEAEWEYMARAGTTTDYTTGNTITPEHANYNGDPHGVQKDENLNRNKTMPVGSFPPNKFGIFDVEGNVREYTQDCWHDDFVGAPTDGTAWIEDGNCNKRVAKSGAWGGTKDEMRTSSRGWLEVTRTSVSYGFRIARSIE